MGTYVLYLWRCYMKNKIEDLLVEIGKGWLHDGV